MIEGLLRILVVALGLLVHLVALRPGRQRDRSARRDGSEGPESEARGR